MNVRCKPGIGGLARLNNSQRRNITCAGIQRPSPNEVSNCYTCTGPCIFKLIELLFILGIIANIIVILTVVRDKRLRKPTFVAIACLALSDAVLLTINAALSFEIVIRSLSCTSPILLTTSKIYSTVIGMAWFSANGHISLMALVRYILLTHPLKAYIYMTNRRILLLSAMVWLAGTIVFVSFYLVGKYSEVSLSRSAEMTSTVWVIVYLMPLLITAVLHCVKLRRVRKASKENGSEYTRISVMRMSRMIVFLVCFAAILPLPKFIYNILMRYEYTYPSVDMERNFRDISLLCFYLNNAVNPFVYAFISDAFRRSLKSMFTRTKNNSNVFYRTRDYSITTNYRLSPESSPQVARQILRTSRTQ